MKSVSSIAVALFIAGCSSSSVLPSTGQTVAHAALASHRAVNDSPSAARCDACMTESCSDALGACKSDTDCIACVTSQDSDACERNAVTHARVDKYLGCRGGACRSACIGEARDTSVAACTQLLSEAVEGPCGTCLAAHCCESVTACHTNSTCWDGCLTNHNPRKCHGDADGHALFHALSACGNTQCKTECAN